MSVRLQSLLLSILLAFLGFCGGMFMGARNVTLINLIFRYYPQTGNPNPGIIKQGNSQIGVVGCEFE